MKINKDFWKGKKVFITGHNGFKGAWLTFWLYKMGVDICGFSLKNNKNNILFKSLNLEKKIKNIYGDILNIKELEQNIKIFQPDILIHLAAQPLVKKSYNDPLETLNTNIIGTANVLNSCRNIPSLKSILIVTTDKCYENKETSRMFAENDKLGGYDPYSASKACAEIITSSFKNSFFHNTQDNKTVGIASARAGNIIGGGDWSEFRLIPDIIKSISQDSEIQIRSPKSTRPWQFVLDALCGYLLLIENLYNNPLKFSGPWNFGPQKDQIFDVEFIVNEILSYFDSYHKVIFSNNYDFHESKELMLDITKAKNILKWKPKFNIKKTIEMTAKWYLQNSKNFSTQMITEEQINEYENF